MMYFIPWVVFLLFVILSVPIASWMDKRKLQAAYRKQFEQEDELDDAEEGDGEQGAGAKEGGADGGTGFSPDEIKLDGDEPRSWQVLEGIDSEELTTKFPDFDVAYLRAAYPTGNSGDHAAALPTILEKGLESCNRRSWLLGRLSAYSVWNRQAPEAFQYAVTALLTARDIADTPGDLVGCVNLLVPVFQASGHADVAEQLQGWNPGYDESPEMQTAIDAAVQSLSTEASESSIATAADALRGKSF